jgi:hypothetical protein
MVATIRIKQLIHRSQLFPQLDVIQFALLLDAEKIPKNTTARSGLVLILDELGRLIPTPLLYRSPHRTTPAT